MWVSICIWKMCRHLHPWHESAFTFDMWVGVCIWDTWVSVRSSDVGRHSHFKWVGICILDTIRCLHLRHASVFLFEMQISTKYLWFSVPLRMSIHVSTDSCFRCSHFKWVGICILDTIRYLHLRHASVFLFELQISLNVCESAHQCEWAH